MVVPGKDQTHDPRTNGQGRCSITPIAIDANQSDLTFLKSVHQNHFEVRQIAKTRWRVCTASVLARALLVSISHACSIGLRSVDWAGHGRTLMRTSARVRVTFLAVCGRALVETNHPTGFAKGCSRLKQTSPHRFEHWRYPRSEWDRSSHWPKPLLLPFCKNVLFPYKI